MINSHNRAEKDVSKILQAFFVIFVIAVIAVFVVKISSHTDGSVVTVDKDNPACNGSTKELLDKTGMGAVKCQE